MNIKNRDVRGMLFFSPEVHSVSPPLVYQKYPAPSRVLISSTNLLYYACLTDTLEINNNKNHVDRRERVEMN